MKPVLFSVRNYLIRNTAWVEGLLIFSATLFIYLANNQLISSNDSVPNSLIAFNWLENHTFHFDAFRQGHYYMPNSIFGEEGIPYFFVEAPNGHLASAYPIGAFIISFPLYLIFFIYLKLTALLQIGNSHLSTVLQITEQSFEPTRQLFEKLAGAILAALTTVIFYLAVKIKFDRPVALWAAFIYSFATLNWVVSSQGLWTHTVSNLALVSIMLCLLKANRAEGINQKLLLITAGFFCGLFPGIRPTSLLFAIAVLLYTTITYRRLALFFILGCASALFNIIWNVYYFGFSLRSLVAGGYSSLFQTSSSYLLTWDYFQDAFWGLLISPSRGILIFSPILLFAIPGVYQLIKRRSQPDERLLGYLLIACLILFFQYCVYVPWWGAITYGSRFLVDTLPVFVYLICYYLNAQFSRIWQKRKRMVTPIFSIFLGCLLFSTFVQVIGAFSTPHIWDTAPGFSQTRFWDWQDSQIERHARNMFLRINNPIPDRKAYRKLLKGKIIQIEDGSANPIQGALTVSPSQELSLQARLKNTGRAQWFGYDTGLQVGRTVVGVKFLNTAGEPVDVLPSYLYVLGSPDPGEQAIAKGIVWCPQTPGDYRMVFNLKLEQIGGFPKTRGKVAYELQVKVVEQAAT